ncbi:MAG: hypothetical protein JSR00_09075 [Bacteroidetes bacterium]|nr:hypothetical protein [Bacteroidota bacterium]
MKNINYLIPLILLFVIIEAGILVFSQSLIQKNISPNVLSGGNIILFLLTVITCLWQKKALNNSNPNVFIRSVMSGILLKMVVAVMIIFIYVNMSGEDFNRRGIFSVMILYFLYLSVEVITISKLNKAGNVKN